MKPVETLAIACQYIRATVHLAGGDIKQVGIVLDDKTYDKLRSAITADSSLLYIDPSNVTRLAYCGISILDPRDLNCGH